MNPVEEKKSEKRRKKKTKFESTTNREESSLLACASEEEICVSQILLELVNLIPIQKRLPKLAWSCRRRRSCLAEAASHSREPSSRSPSIQKAPREEVEVKLGKVTAEVEGSPAAASSPATPLSFSPSESDEKSKHYSKKDFKKRSRKEYNDMIERLTHHGNSLRMEIETARNHHNKLKIHNSELKRLKEEEMLKTWRRRETAQMEVSRFGNLGIDLTQQHYQIKVLAPRQPLVADPTADDFNRSIGPFMTNNPESCLSNGGRDLVNLVGQVRIPDLNLSAEEAFGLDPSQPLDEGKELADKRVRFAEARRLRRGIIKIKSMRKACGIKLPRTGY